MTDEREFIRETIRLAKELGLIKKMGQHLLVNVNILKREVEYAYLNKNDIVLEIGAGLGNLTYFLAKKAKKVVAIEKDKRLAEILEKRFKDFGNVEVVVGDALEIDYPPFNKIVSNIPYLISSQITFRILRENFDIAVLTYQKEFAERLVAKPGTKNYSKLSVACYFYAKAKILEYIPRTVFFPKPKVDSAVVEIIKRDKPKFDIDEKLYFKIVKGVFSYRRKTLKNALINAGFSKYIDSIPENLLKERVFKLSPEDFAKICEIISSS